LFGSGRPQYEIDVDFVIRENDPPVVGAVEHTGFEQRLRVAVNGFDVPIYPPG